MHFNQMRSSCTMSHIHTPYKDIFQFEGSTVRECFQLNETLLHNL